MRTATSPLSLVSMLMTAPAPLVQRIAQSSNPVLALTNPDRQAHCDQKVREMFDLFDELTSCQVRDATGISYKGARAALERAVAAGTAEIRQRGHITTYHRTH